MQICTQVFLRAAVYVNEQWPRHAAEQTNSPSSRDMIQGRRHVMMGRVRKKPMGPQLSRRRGNRSAGSFISVSDMRSPRPMHETTVEIMKGSSAVIIDSRCNRGRAKDIYILQTDIIQQYSMAGPCFVRVDLVVRSWDQLEKTVHLSKYQRVGGMYV